MARYILYFHNYCFFCRSVLAALPGLSFSVDTRDILASPEYQNELYAGGGSSQVPCLRILRGEEDEQWMYESSDIIAYLQGVDTDGAGAD